MSRGNRGLYAAFGIVAVLAAYGWGNFALYQVAHRNQGNEVAAQTRDNPPEQFQTKCVWRGFSHFECITPHQGAQGADPASNYDLRAQQDMAEWAYSLLWVSIVSTFVTACGVIYVALTLNETRKATEAAAKAADAAVKANDTTLLVGSNQARAYLTIRPPCAPIEGEAVFSYAVSNSGTTPARGIKWEYRLRFGGRLLETDSARLHSLADIPGGNEPVDQIILEHQATWLREAIDQLTLKRRGYFHIVVRYRDVFGRCFELSERMEMVGRRPMESHEIFLSHVHSDEREISRKEYDNPIRLPEEK